MTRIPHEIDELIWQVADSGDPRARLEFVGRYPQWADELDRRAAFVRRLRSARPVGEPGRFDSLGHRALARRSGAWPWAAVALAVVALAAASIILMKVTTTPTTPWQQAPETLRAVPEVTLDLRPHRAGSDARQDARISEPEERRPQEPAAKAARGPSLVRALRDLAKQSGLRLEFAPGFEDLQIRIEVRYTDHHEALRRLGREFGFTALEQTEGSFLLVPAVDAGGDPQPLERSETRNKWPPTED
jgi:hypothetical protein